MSYQLQIGPPIIISDIVNVVDVQTSARPLSFLHGPDDAVNEKYPFADVDHEIPQSVPGSRNVASFGVMGNRDTPDKVSRVGVVPEPPVEVFDRMLHRSVITPPI